MIARASSLVATAALAVAVLAGCVPAATFTVPAATIAETAEGALEQQVGSRPDLDCGTEDVEVRKGAVVDCVLTDPATGDRFTAPVTIESVDGTEYSIGVQVAEEPIKD